MSPAVTLTGTPAMPKRGKEEEAEHILTTPWKTRESVSFLSVNPAFNLPWTIMMKNKKMYDFSTPG
jgi:hypothetical protein